jgi:hypothetical protein
MASNVNKKKRITTIGGAGSPSLPVEMKPLSPYEERLEIVERLRVRLLEEAMDLSPSFRCSPGVFREIVKNLHLRD